MPWRKLKNIILLILVLTNLFLLSLVIHQNLQNSRQNSQTRENTILFLTQRGVQVEEKDIPQRMELLPQSVERDLKGEQEAAVSLLKGDVVTEARGGEIYRYYNDRGWIQFHGDGSFSAQLEPGVCPVENQEADCAAVLAAMGFEGELLEETEESLLFQQIWNSVPVYSQQVMVACVEGSVSTISGQRLLGEPKWDSTRETISVSTAMVRFLNGVTAMGDVCNRIDQVAEGYVCSATLAGSMALTPVWQITTDTGVYQLDAVTGAVRRAN